jgi:hypothetical protein
MPLRTPSKVLQERKSDVRTVEPAITGGLVRRAGRRLRLSSRGSP